MDNTDSADIEMGPGMDLVISLLAFVVVILTLLAIERKAEVASQALGSANIVSIPAEEYQEFQSSQDISEGRIVEVENDLARSQAEANAARDDARAAGIARDLAQSEVDALRAEITASANAAIDLGKQSDFLSRREGELTKRLDELGRSLNTALASLAQKERALNGQTERTNKLVEENELLAQKLAVKVLNKESASNAGQQSISEVDNLKRALERQQSENAALLEDANAQLSAFDSRIAQLQQLLDAANEQLRLQERRIAVNLNDSSDLEVFEQGKANLTPRGRIEMYRLLPGLLNNMALQKTNVVRVAGHASPERMARGIRRGFDNHLQLSAERALTIAYELASLGVPMRCIAIEGYGRSRSATLQNFLQGSLDLDSFDNIYSKVDSTQRLFWRRSFPKERRVEILATFEKDGQCSYQLLLNGFRKAVTEARSRVR